VKGRVCEASSGDNHNVNRPWDGKGTLPCTLARTAKSRPGLGPTLIERRRKEACFLARARLSSYLYRLCVMCVHLSMLGVVSTPPQQGIGRMGL
jgi:hypothetical protein